MIYRFNLVFVTALFALVLGVGMTALPDRAHAGLDDTAASAADTVGRVLSREEITLARQAHDGASESLASVSNGDRETVNVHVVSWRDLPFQTVKKQTFDYSCGSAALATLLTYVYGVKTSEADVFESMFTVGDQDKIRKEGFSLLDMSNYLNSRGFKAVGYKMTLETAERARAPFIALVNNEGYNHFVVVKSISGNAVLVGDPNKGNAVYTRETFMHIWNGIALIVMNDASKARETFADKKDWRYARVAARADYNNLIAVNDIHAGSINAQVAPTGVDVLSPIMGIATGGQLSVQVQ